MYYKIYKGVRDSAWRCLADHDISSLPVDVMKIARLNKIPVKKDSLVGILKPDEQAKAYFNGSKWIIIYDDSNDLLTNRFSIAHELGHIFLNHVSDYFKYKDVEDDGKKNKSEQQADMFAQRLLCPMSVLHHLDVTSPEEISKICLVPLDCATERSKRLKMLRTKNKFLTSRVEARMFEKFKPFILEFKAQKEETENLE